MEARKAALVRIALRIFGILFGVIVLGCIGDKLLESTPKGTSCAYGKVAACEFGMACGALALMVAIVFTPLDVLTDVHVNEIVKSRRAIIMKASIAFSVIMGVLWLCCFAVLTKQWVDVEGHKLPTEYKSPGEATLAFSFLSILVWITVAVLGGISLRSETTT